MEQNISIIMPIYNQASFVRGALASLERQTFKHWELLIIDDGSTDGVNGKITDYLNKDSRIRYVRNEHNEGLGYSLNLGMQLASYPIVSYLPADDIYYDSHLETMLKTMVENDAQVVVSGMLYNEDNVGGEGKSTYTMGTISEKWLQLVQVMHRRTDLRWLERKELATDDLGRMFWNQLLQTFPKVAYTNKITCEWTSHLFQRHRVMSDREFGGIYMYKTYYHVKEAIHYQSSSGNYIDEITHYQAFRNLPHREDGLKILLVGELSYNPERIVSLEKRGHKLYGLWIDNPFNFNSNGNFPFGHVEDIPLQGWEEKIKEIKPDIICGMTNFKGLELSWRVFKKVKDIPFVWHFKEGPFYCRSYGAWEKLIELYEHADGAIYINETARDWYHLYMEKPNANTLVLDADLPPEEWFKGERSPLLSAKDGEMHTVIAGRLLGISVNDIEQMAEIHIHLHVYGDIFQDQSRMLIDEAMAVAPDYIHLHPNCPSEKWVSELSQYDAGWLHYYKSNNHGDLLRANWIDFNSPARLSTYAAAGLPMIMHDNSGNVVHHQQYLEKMNMALPISSIKQLKEYFDNKPLMEKKREDVWRNRMEFCFDKHVEELEEFFHRVINSKKACIK